MNQKKFVGLDVHKETIAIVVIDEQGKVIVQSVIATDGETICDFLKGLSGEIHVTFEVGTQSTGFTGKSNRLSKKSSFVIRVIIICC